MKHRDGKLLLYVYIYIYIYVYIYTYIYIYIYMYVYIIHLVVVFASNNRFALDLSKQRQIVKIIYAEKFLIKFVRSIVLI